jgi:hypothetical protein
VNTLSPRSRAEAACNGCLNGLFLLALLVPAGSRWLGLAPEPQATENRTVHPRPDLPTDGAGWFAFPQWFEAYWNDHFGFRDALIDGHSRLLYFGLQTSSSEHVVLGREGWLFYRGFHSFYDEDPISDYRSSRPLDEAHLQQWKSALEGRHDWLHERDISYVVLLVPNMSTVYPEFMAPGIVQGSASSPIDQVATMLTDHDRLHVIDLRPDFLALKSDRRLFLRTDTHWNHLGAFFAYRAIMGRMQSLFPRLTPAREISDFHPVYPVWRPGGDLTQLMGLEDVILEEWLFAEPKEPWQAVDVTPVCPTRLKPLERCGARKPPSPARRGSWSLGIPLLPDSRSFSASTSAGRCMRLPMENSPRRPDPGREARHRHRRGPRALPPPRTSHGSRLTMTVAFFDRRIRSRRK